MGLWSAIMGRNVEARTAPAVRADFGDGVLFHSLKDPALLEFVRDGMMTATGMSVGVEKALRNPAMFRACSLIANSMGMLPFQLIDRETKEKATDHSLYPLLHRRPNDWQSAFDFRGNMQLQALVHGDGYALVVRSKDLRSGKEKVAKLIPLDARQVEPKLTSDWRVQYKYQPKNGGAVTYAARDILHLRGISLDGVKGFSLVKQAREAVALALSAELASGRIFKNGAFVDGVLVAKSELSENAYQRLKESWAARYAGADNAGKTPLLEGDTDYKAIGSTAKDAQMAEIRKLQVEEIARVTGVPRPLLMVDETSWGSGIEALGQFFVAYALNPWFEAWQQAVERTLLSDEEAARYEAKFNPAALLRGSLKDQADFLSKALGAGGHAPWMHVDEVRDVMDLPKREDPPHTMAGGATEPSPEPGNTSKQKGANDDQD